MTTKMLEETLQTSTVLKKQWSENTQKLEEITSILRKINPYCFITFARGSSDHAAAYFNYIASLELKKLSTSLTPSLVSVHDLNLDFSRALGVGISQSGKGPDILSLIKKVNSQKSLTLALVNNVDSPLANEAKLVYPLWAGKEISVAATKSFIASIYAAASIIAKINENKKLLEAIEKSPDFLPKELDSHWDNIINILKDSERTMIVGRGLGYAIAHEAALKLKETCHIQAESISSAEIKHGPQAVVGHNYPLIIFALRGVEQESLIELGLEMRKRGANVCIICDKLISEKDCLYTPSTHTYLDPMNLIYSFYLMVQKLALVKGLDPDNPRFLSKVTMTT